MRALKTLSLLWVAFCALPASEVSFAAEKQTRPPDPVAPGQSIPGLGRARTQARICRWLVPGDNAYPYWRRCCDAPSLISSNWLRYDGMSFSFPGTCAFHGLTPGEEPLQPLKN